MHHRGFLGHLSIHRAAAARRLRIATGGPQGAYYAFAQDYAKILAEDEVTLEVQETSGSVENLSLLLDPASGIDLAFVQGGIGEPENQTDLIGLASLYYEPLWVFARAGEEPESARDLIGKTLAAGSPGSGTRVLVEELLSASGLSGQVQLIDLGGAEGAQALRNGEADLALFVAGLRSPAVQDLVADPRLDLRTSAGPKPLPATCATSRPFTCRKAP